MKLSYTNRTRLVLVLSPILILLEMILILFYVLKRALEELQYEIKYIGRVWYREIYRPARYGSVWDDVDENGYPLAWKKR